MSTSMTKYPNLTLPAWPTNTIENLDSNLTSQIEKHSEPIDDIFKTQESLQEYRTMLKDFANSYAQTQITDKSIEKQFIKLPRQGFALGDLGDGDLDVAVWDLSRQETTTTPPVSRALIYISPGCCTFAQPDLCEEFIQTTARSLGAQKAFSPAHRGVPEFSLMHGVADVVLLQAHVHSSFQEVIVMGSSSGSEMGFFSELLHNKLTGKSSKVVVTLHSAGLLEPDMESFTDPRVPPLYFSRTSMASLGGKIRGSMPKSKDLSSSLQATIAYSQLVPEDLKRIKAIVSLSAEFDVMRDGAIKLAIKMKELNIPVTYHVSKKAAHCTMETFPNLEISKAARDWVVKETLAHLS